MGDFRRPRPNVGDQKSPKLPLDLTVFMKNINLVLIILMRLVVLRKNGQCKICHFISFCTCSISYITNTYIVTDNCRQSAK